MKTILRGNDIKGRLTFLVNIVSQQTRRKLTSLLISPRWQYREGFCLYKLEVLVFHERHEDGC